MTSSAFSIVIPCFNSERWLREAISSALSQTLRPSEIVIVDDGSTDNTAQIAAHFAQAHPQLIRIVRQPNRGACAARTAGLEAARSPYIAFVDADDRLLPDAIAIFSKAFEKGAQIAYGRAYRIDEGGRRLGPRPQDPSPSGDPFVSLFEAHPTTSSVAFSRSVLVECPWDNSLPCTQEFDLLTRCAMHGVRFGFEPEYVAEIREHGSPEGITNKAAPIFSLVASRNMLRYRKFLLDSRTMTPSRSSALHFAMLHHAVALARQGHLSFAREVLRGIDRRAVLRARKFKLLSEEAAALFGGLTLSTYVRKVKRALLRAKD